jgi:hypothetical protein
MLVGVVEGLKIWNFGVQLLNGVLISNSILLKNVAMLVNLCVLEKMDLVFVILGSFVVIVKLVAQNSAR